MSPTLSSASSPSSSFNPPPAPPNTPSPPSPSSTLDYHIDPALLPPHPNPVPHLATVPMETTRTTLSTLFHIHAISHPHPPFETLPSLEQDAASRCPESLKRIWQVPEGVLLRTQNARVQRQGVQIEEIRRGERNHIPPATRQSAQTLALPGLYPAALNSARLPRPQRPAAPAPLTASFRVLATAPAPAPLAQCRLGGDGSSGEDDNEATTPGEPGSSSSPGRDCNGMAIPPTSHEATSRPSARALADAFCECARCRPEDPLEVERREGGEEGKDSGGEEQGEGEGNEEGEARVPAPSPTIHHGHLETSLSVSDEQWYRSYRSSTTPPSQQASASAPIAQPLQQHEEDLNASLPDADEQWYRSFHGARTPPPLPPAPAPIAPPSTAAPPSPPPSPLRQGASPSPATPSLPARPQSSPNASLASLPSSATTTSIRLHTRRVSLGLALVSACERKPSSKWLAGIAAMRRAGADMDEFYETMMLGLQERARRKKRGIRNRDLREGNRRTRGEALIEGFENFLARGAGDRAEQAL